MCVAYDPPRPPPPNSISSALYTCFLFNAKFGLIEIKYLEMQYFWRTKVDFPLIWVGFVTGSGSISSKVLWIQILQNDTDPVPDPDPKH